MKPLQRSLSPKLARLTPYPLRLANKCKQPETFFSQVSGCFVLKWTASFQTALSINLGTSFHTRIVQNNRDIAFGFVHIRHVDFLAFKFCFNNGFQRGNTSGEAEFFIVCGNKFDRFFMK